MLLHTKGILNVEYEHRTVEDTSVDFRVETDRVWLVELVSIAKSKAVEAATEPNEDYPFITETVLSSMKAIEPTSRFLSFDIVFSLWGTICGARKAIRKCRNLIA